MIILFLIGRIWHIENEKMMAAPIVYMSKYLAVIMSYKWDRFETSDLTNQITAKYL